MHAGAEKNLLPDFACIPMELVLILRRWFLSTLFPNSLWFLLKHSRPLLFMHLCSSSSARCTNGLTDTSQWELCKLRAVCIARTQYAVPWNF